MRNAREQSICNSNNTNYGPNYWRPANWLVKADIWDIWKILRCHRGLLSDTVYIYGLKYLENIEVSHDDVSIWKCFPHYWPFVREIHQSLVDFPHKGPVMWSFDVIVLLAEQTVQQTVKLIVIWNAMTVILCNWAVEVSGRYRGVRQGDDVTLCMFMKLIVDLGWPEIWYILVIITWWI